MYVRIIDTAISCMYMDGKRQGRCTHSEYDTSNPSGVGCLSHGGLRGPVAVGTQERRHGNSRVDAALTTPISYATFSPLPVRLGSALRAGLVNGTARSTVPWETYTAVR